jgi:sensor domain CHASE-containing protein/nitrogen-specific signal transduction histidine kinase
MSIRKKFLGTICGITLCLILIFYGVISLVIQKNYGLLEKNVVIDSIERVRATLNSQVESLGTLVHDWASWDDTYVFVNDHNEDFIASNIDEDTFVTSAKIDLLLIFDNDKNLVHGAFYNKKNNQIENVHPALFHLILAHDHLLNQSSLTAGTSGIIQLGSNKQLLIAARPILTSNGEGPVLGTLMMGRIFDSERIAQFQEITRTSVDFYSVDNCPAEGVNALQELQVSQSPYYVDILSEVLVRGYTLLDDVSGDPVLLLAVNMDRSIHYQSHKTLFFLLYSIIFICVVFGFVIFSFMDILVTGRLSTLTADIVQIEKNAIAGSRVRESTSRDELGKLSISINHMLDAIESLEEYKVKSEKLEALATFAAGATHELATPLATIAIASGEILQDLKTNTTNEEELRVDILLIREQVNRCKDILYQITADSGEHMGEEVASFSISQFIHDILAFFDQETVKLIEVDNQVGDRIITVPALSLRRVLRGILKNSIDASAVGKPIFLSCYENDNHLFFEIRDQGEGMDDYTRKHAVEPFFTTKPPGSGMGLGLYLAHSLSSRFGGDLQILSSPDAGTTVTLSFAKERIYG